MKSQDQSQNLSNKVKEIEIFYQTLFNCTALAETKIRKGWTGKDDLFEIKFKEPSETKIEISLSPDADAEPFESGGAWMGKVWIHLWHRDECYSMNDHEWCETPPPEIVAKVEALKARVDQLFE